MSVWRKLLSFFGLRSDSLHLPALNSDTPLTFELELEDLDYIRYRRQILDWRDNFASQLLADAGKGFQEFKQQVEKEISDVGILRKVFAKPAAEVLKEDFDQLVRAPLAKCQADTAMALEKMFQGCSHGLAVAPIDPQLSILEDISFRAAKQDEVVSSLRRLVFDDGGMIDAYLKPAQVITQSLLVAYKQKQ